MFHNFDLGYTANNFNRYSAVGGTSYSYDNNGNLHSDGTNTWNFDALNRLTSSSTTAPGGVSTTETYDPLDRLDTYNPGSLQRFIYDGGEVVARLDSSGNITGRFVRGDGPDELLASYPDAGTTNRRWVGLDERNSVIALSDGSGNLTNINRYSEYGVPQSTNSTMDQYTGQLWIAGAGLQYSKARVYSPSLGRFLQMDPAGYAGGANLYAYVLNDPVNATDPTGLLRTLRYCFNPGGPAGEGPGGSIDIVGRVCVNVTVWDPEDFDSLFSRNQFVNLIEGALINPPSKPTCEHLLHVANGLENAGGKIQDFGASASAAGFTGDLIALAFPPAEIGTGSLTAAGGLITLAGTAVSGAGSTLNFFATHDLGRAALSVVGVLAGRLKASNDAHKFLRGLNIGKAVDLNKALSPSRCQ